MNEIMLQLVNYWILTPVSLFFRFLLVVSICAIIRRLMVLRSKKGKVTVVVLGDIGRSPRMQYHSLSLSKHEFKVKFVGYSGSIPHQSIMDAENIRLYFMKESFITAGGSKLLTYFLKVIFQSLYLVWTLVFQVGATEFVLLQNPPCIPSLAVCWFMSLFNGSTLIVDWHNYGYSILALSLGKSHLLVKIARWYEEMFGQLSHNHLCVTQAMAQDMMQRWNISAEVMHDRPAPMFKSLDIKEKHKMFLKLAMEYSQFKSNDLEPSSTRFTIEENGKVRLRSKRPALLVSSTSWTEDEDFSILLEALQGYENEVGKCKSTLPSILCAITGKGPLKAHYQKIIASKSWKHIEIITPWLEAEDYPKLLACADLGVSLHTSSSGLDLPMKVVDMFGSGLPVAAINFKCLNELVQHNVNGVVFDKAETLTEQLIRAFDRYSYQQIFLDDLRQNVKEFQKITWDDSWNKIVLPLFKS